MNQSILSSCAHVFHFQRARAEQPWVVLSAAEKFSLKGSTNPCISHFYSFKGKSDQTFVIPDACIDILFDCDPDQPTAQVYGTPLQATAIQLKPSHRYFGVRFALGLIPECLKVSAEELIEQHFNLLDVIPGASSLLEQINIHQGNFIQQAAQCQRFFEYQEARELSPLTRKVARYIFERRGNLQMKELEKFTNYNLRSIQRRFREDMGMSPKVYSRIIRCQSAIYHLNYLPRTSASELAFDLGFSDQSHFLREFKTLVSTTPLTYQKQLNSTDYMNRIRFC